jgi:Helix-turn-helix domain
MPKLPLQQFIEKEEKSAFRFTRAVLAIQTTTPAQKAVLMALAIRAHHKTGTCHPSYDRLMSDTGLSRSVVAATIKYLRDELKVLDWKQGHSNQYTKPLANLYRLDYRIMAALGAESAESDSGSAESDSESAEYDWGVAESATRTPTAQDYNCSITTTAQDSNCSISPPSKDFDYRQEGMCVARQSKALSPASELSKVPAHIVHEALDFAEYDPSYREKPWGARRNLSRELTPIEIAEIQRLNRERVQPQ